MAADRQDGCLESEGRGAAQQTGSLVNDSHSPPPRPSHESPPPPPPLTTPTMRLLIRQSPVGRETEITCSVTLRTRRPLVTKALCARTNAAHRLFLAMGGVGGSSVSRTLAAPTLATAPHIISSKDSRLAASLHCGARGPLKPASPSRSSERAKEAGDRGSNDSWQEVKRSGCCSWHSTPYIVLFLFFFFF